MVQAGCILMSISEPNITSTTNWDYSLISQRVFPLSAWLHTFKPKLNQLLKIIYMKNKVTLLIILLAGITIPAIQSCKKYSEGPALSFRSKTERVANTWKIDNYKVNGSDYTSLVAGYVETYSKDG